MFFIEGSFTVSTPLYTVDPTTAQDATVTLGQATSAIKDSLLSLQSQVESTLADWNNSQAKSAYEDAKTKWNTAADTMPTDLANAQSALTQIIDSYNQAELTGQKMWSSQG
ncbi:MAG TPA: WXG100 family type VII secretion target [Pseudonocardiaceae bacterium]|jgi:uncharacterized protein YukE|nr:WXG100 family type VII secretion target [Pseudonocardiaceae bacterium]